MGESLKNRIRVSLMGGIGNQLFIYFAGRFLADKYQKQLQINFASIKRYGIIHEGDISVLSLDGEIVHEDQTSSKVMRLLDRINKYFSRKNIVYRRTQYLVQGKFITPETGYDERLENSKRANQIFGYFQTWRYFESDREKYLKTFQLKNPSDWFIAQSAKIGRECPIALHIRRGDYLNLKDDFGVLAVGYYKEAIRHALENTSSTNVWIFSDDIDSAKTFAPLFRGVIFTFISPPKKCHPIESLLLMSKCEILIIANSTFSYWAALIGPNNSRVIAPDKWFKNRQEPRDLIPPSWKRINSSWID